jgi:hypothetical protein
MTAAIAEQRTSTLWLAVTTVATAQVNFATLVY